MTFIKSIYSETFVLLENWLREEKAFGEWISLKATEKCFTEESKGYRELLKANKDIQSKLVSEKEYICQRLK